MTSEVCRLGFMPLLLCEVKMQRLKMALRVWWRFWIAIGPLGGIAVGVVAGNIIEAYMHDVSVFDATFIESWKK